MRKRRRLMYGVARARCAWIDYLRQVSAAEGVPDSYRPIIMFLRRNPGSSQRSIAEFTGVTASAVNQVVKSMLSDGYLRKETASADKRGSELYLTERGEEIAERLRRRLDAADDAITAFVGAQREEALMDFLHELTDFIQTEVSKC